MTFFSNKTLQLFNMMIFTQKLTFILMTYNTTIAMCQPQSYIHTHFFLHTHAQFVYGHSSNIYVTGNWEYCLEENWHSFHYFKHRQPFTVLYCVCTSTNTNTQKHDKVPLNTCRTLKCPPFFFSKERIEKTTWAQFGWLYCTSWSIIPPEGEGMITQRVSIQMHPFQQHFDRLS